MHLKSIKYTVIVLALCGIVSLMAGCIGTSSANTATTAQTATVQLGSISIDVTGTGNLALKNKQSLSFGQTGLVSNVETAKVAEVNVVEGQVVDKGQTLVKADTSDWKDRITSLQHKMDAAKANLIQSQAGVNTAQYNQATTQYNTATAKQNLATAQYNLKIQTDVKAAQDKIDNANIQLQQAKAMYNAALQSQSSGNQTADIQYWQSTINNYNADITKYQKDLQDLLNDPATKGAPVTDINTRQTAVQQAQAAVDQTQAAIAQAQKNIELAQANVIVAQNAVDDAQSALITEQNSAQVITAPIQGLITKVNVNQGDIIQRNTNIIEIAAPDKFEARIMVSERDVTSLSIGKDSQISLDAIGLSFQGKITRIAPLGTIQQGVVNYLVTVELTSTTPISGTASSGVSKLPVTLKEGFSAVVTIPVQKKDNILIVPSKAISHPGQDYTVEVKTATTTETRIVKIGITDFQNTEILEGLKQGETVVIPAIPASTSTNSGNPFGG